MKQFLESSTVKLTRFTDRHITPQYLDWVNDQVCSQYVNMGRIPVISRDINIPDPMETLLFAVIAKFEDNVRYIGIASIHSIDWLSGKADIGYMIGDRELWGKGYATEIVSMLVDYAFNRMGLRKLNADVIAQNIASVKILENAGFKLWGTNPKDFYLNGEFLDNKMYCMFRDLDK